MRTHALSVCKTAWVLHFVGLGKAHAHSQTNARAHSPAHSRCTHAHSHMRLHPRTYRTHSYTRARMSALAQRWKRSPSGCTRPVDTRSAGASAVQATPARIKPPYVTSRTCPRPCTLARTQHSARGPRARAWVRVRAHALAEVHAVPFQVPWLTMQARKSPTRSKSSSTREVRS